MRNILLLLVTTSLLAVLTHQKASSQRLIESVAAVVGNEVIYLSDIEQMVNMIRMNQPSADLSKARCELLEDAIEQKLYIDQARIDSIIITPSMVDPDVNMRLNMAIQQAGSEERLEEYYRKSIFEIREDLREVMVNDYIVQSVQSDIASGVSITPSEVRRFYNSLHPDSIPVVPARVEVSIIQADPPRNEENRLLARGRLLEIRSDILSGSRSFEMAARLYSEDPETAVRGGETGLLSRNSLSREYANVAFSISPNTVSRVIETEFGFHIIQLIERSGDLANTRHILIRPRLTAADQEKAVNKLDSIANLIRSDEVTFETAARRWSTHSDSKTSGGRLVRGDYNERVRMFELESLDSDMYQVVRDLNVGEISKAFKTTDERNRTVFRIVRLDREIPAHRANLEDDFELLKRYALAEKRQKLFDEWVEKKLEVTYIRISQEFKDCDFRHSRWLR